jgi:hypothetical protein
MKKDWTPGEEKTLIRIVVLFVCIGPCLVSQNERRQSKFNTDHHIRGVGAALSGRAISLFYYLLEHGGGRNALLYEGTGINLAPENALEDPDSNRLSYYVYTSKHLPRRINNHANSCGLCDIVIWIDGFGCFCPGN